MKICKCKCSDSPVLYNINTEYFATHKLNDGDGLFKKVKVLRYVPMFTVLHKWPMYLLIVISAQNYNLFFVVQFE